METNIELYTKYLAQIGRRITPPTGKLTVWVVQSVIAFKGLGGGIEFRLELTASDWTEARLTLEELGDLERGVISF
jgi:hypothetical protein